MKNERFEVIYSQGKLTVTEIWVDKVTGVNYLYHVFNCITAETGNLCRLI